MQILLIYLFLFLFGAILGWVIELLFRRFVSAKKWVNPGFMRGPWLPLYGFGVVVMLTMTYVCSQVFPNDFIFYNPLGNLFGRTNTNGATFYDLIPIVLMWSGMVLLEFIAGIIFIKGFKVKLWDYTNLKGNIMGIICPLFSFIWLVVSVIYYYLLNPYIYNLSLKVYDYMFGINGERIHFGFIFILGIMYGFMIYDFVTSINLFASISRFAKDSGVIKRYEDLKQSLKTTIDENKKKLFATLPEKIKLGKITQKEKKIESDITKKISEALYIDPSKEKNKSANYDESGRPIKMEDEKND